MRAPRLLLVTLVCCLCGLPCVAQSAQVQAKHTRVELLSSKQESGGILLGLHFVLEKGWHIYWVNPGDSGQPPSFHWKLPAGSTAGEIQWPRPERLQSSPTIVDYGYRDGVLLMVPVRLPGAQRINSKTDIAVEARWLICREVCLPDHAHLALSLPATEPENPRTARLFAATRALLPRPWPKQWKATAESGKDVFILTITTGKRLAAADFFPLDPGQIDNSARQKVEPTATGAKLLLKKSDLLVKPVPELRGILVVDGRGYRLRAPVVAQVAIK